MNASEADALIEQLHGLASGFKYDLPRRQRPVAKIHRQNRCNFFSLPGEIRNTIYSYAVKQDTKIFLQGLRLPGICRVNRQTSQETLALFFELNTFIMEVAAPVALRSDWQVLQQLLQFTTRAHFFARDDPRFSQTGLLLLRPTALETLQNSTSKVLIRNLDLVPLNFETPRGKRCEHLHAVLSLCMPEGTNQPQVTHHVHGSMVGYRDALEDPQLRADLDHITTSAAMFLRNLASRNGFQGLSLSELAALARQIRVYPRVGPDALIDTLE